MLTHSFYESDNRVVRYAEALAERGDMVEVVALRRSPELPREEKVGRVRVFRIQDRFGKREQSKSSYAWPLVRFLIASSWWLTRHHWREPYHVVHVHNIPDFLVFAAWLPKLTGASLILDIHDLLPELFGSIFCVSERSGLVWLLKRMEGLSAAFADHVILANHLWLEKYTSRSAAAGKCSVFINHVDSRIFKLRPTCQRNSKPRILFPGSLHWHQGVDLALHAFAKVRCRLPAAEFHIYGEGSMKPSLLHLTEELGLNGSVQFFDPLPIREIAGVMAQADLGIVPKRADSFGNEAYSTKIMEFMSVGVPVVVANTKIDQFYFNDSIVRFFQSGNPDSLAEAMFDVLSNEELRCGMAGRAQLYVAKNGWETRKADYLRLVDSVSSPAGPATQVSLPVSN